MNVTVSGRQLGIVCRCCNRLEHTSIFSNTEILYIKKTFKLGWLNNVELDQQVEPKWVESSLSQAKGFGPLPQLRGVGIAL